MWVDSAIEILWIWLLSPLLYPMYMAETWVDFYPWYSLIFAVALAAYVLLKKIARPSWFKPVVVVLLMPGTIICGSFTAVPWPMALLFFFGEGNCATFLSLSICLSLNTLVVYGISSIWKRLKRVQNLTSDCGSKSSRLG